jgi:RHS repeat-associated protein
LRDRIKVVGRLKRPKSNCVPFSRSWDDANRALTLCNIYSTIDYAYDAAGLLWKEGNTIAGTDRAVTTYSHYPGGNVSDIRYPSGISVHREYTARGQLKSVGDSLGSQPVIDYTYLADGKVDHADYRNGVRSAYQYDGRGMTRVVDHYRIAGTQDLSWREYTRDARDRITSFRKGTSGYNPMENGRGDRFWYDEEGQLVEAWYNAADPANSGTGNTRYDSFNYDALGNRRSWNYVQSHGWQKFSRKDNGLNQYSMWSPFSLTNYDDDIGGTWGSPRHANGVLMQDGNVTAGYNALNQPMYIFGSGGWTNFGYDPLGRCVKRWKDDGSTLYLYYEGWNVIQEGSSSSSASRNYVHGARIDEIVKSVTYGAGGQEACHHYDARGHCTLVTTSSGNILEQYEYDAFGYPYFYDSVGTNATLSFTGNRFLFTGREWLSDLKLYDYRNRMYQPELGRFMQPDPKQFAAGDYNLYRYCHNDPVNRSDPTGLISTITVELQKLKTVLGSNIPQWVTTVKVGISGLFEKAKADHQDRTQSVFKDGSLSRITIGKIGTNHTMGRFERNKFRSEEIPLDASRPLALILHIHNDIHNNATTKPSPLDAGAVIGYQVPMVFSSESLYSAGQGILLTPRGQAYPNQVPIDVSR